MDASHDDTGVTAAARQVDNKAPRAPWRRPALRAVPAREAEVGFSITFTDGAFTTS